MLIHPARQEGEEDTEAQSFVVPVPNGIQLETRHPSQRPDAAHDADAEVCQGHDRHILLPASVVQHVMTGTSSLLSH